MIERLKMLSKYFLKSLHRNNDTLNLLVSFNGEYKNKELAFLVFWLSILNRKNPVNQQRHALKHAVFELSSLKHMLSMMWASYLGLTAS